MLFSKKGQVYLLAAALGLICSLWGAEAQGGADTWTFVQESHITYCTATASFCSSAAGTIIPTVANSVRVITVWTNSDVTITGASGGGTTWQPCSNCHKQLPGGDNVDMIYGIGGTAGQTNFTVNLSGGANGLFLMWFAEFLPPAGSTASLDDSNSVTSSGNCATCTLVPLTLTATDLVYQQRIGAKPAPWHAFSAPYVQTPANNALGLNVSSGAAPTMTASGTEPAAAAALAFKSTAGTFTPPTANIVPKHSTATSTTAGIACAPSCSLTIPATTAGNLLFLASSTTNGTTISSVSGGGTWVVPATGSGTGTTCQSHGTSGSVNYGLGCAYVLSASASTTSVNITMSGSGQNPAYFELDEISPNGGTFSLDAQGSTANAASYNPSGQSLTLTGTDDAIFQGIAVSGGESGNSYYYLFSKGPDGNQLNSANTSMTFLADVATGITPQWANQQNDTTLVTGAAFKLNTGPPRPQPPTNLTAVPM